MGAKVYSFTFKGKDRHSISDFVSYSSRGDVDFIMVVDGHSGRDGSSSFSEKIIGHVKECFDCCSVQKLMSNSIREEVFGWIEEGRRNNRKKFPAAAASFIIFIKFERVALVVRAGDCCMGRVGGFGDIRWITRVHSYVCLDKRLSIGEIAGIDDRSLLTNSLKARRKCSPEWKVTPVVNNGCLVFATDGFWGEISESEQIKMVEILKGGGEVPLEMLSEQSDDVGLVIYAYGENSE